MMLHLFCKEETWGSLAISSLSVAGTIAVLLSLSYSVISYPLKALSGAWSHLRPGGHVAILDSPVRGGASGACRVPFSLC